jgi:hypothetical protein
VSINTRPHYGEPVGHLDAKGRVILNEVFEKFIDDLVGALGSNTASVRTMEGITSYLSAQLLNQPTVHVAAGDYECTGHEDVVIATGALSIITLPDAPRDRQTIKVLKDTASAITIDGNGRLTMGAADVLFNSGRYSVLDMTYVVERDAWYAT